MGVDFDLKQPRDRLTQEPAFFAAGCVAVDRLAELVEREGDRVAGGVTAALAPAFDREREDLQVDESQSPAHLKGAQQRSGRQRVGPGAVGQAAELERREAREVRLDAALVAVIALHRVRN